MLSVARKGGVEAGRPEHIRHDESGTTWLQPNVNRSNERQRLWSEIAHSVAPPSSPSWTRLPLHELDTTGMAAQVRAIYSGLLTCGMHYSALTAAGFYDPGSTHLWEDLDLDIIGISAWFPLVDLRPSTALSVATLQSRLGRSQGRTEERHRRGQGQPFRIGSPPLPPPVGDGHRHCRPDRQPHRRLGQADLLTSPTAEQAGVRPLRLCAPVTVGPDSVHRQPPAFQHRKSSGRAG